jgi:two-component system response regulator GlrR
MPRQINGQHLVIVEDDPLIRETLMHFFGDRNMVTTYPSAEDIIAVEGQLQAVNVFIFDYKLPGMDGITLFQHFRPKFPASKFILITGEMSYEMAEKTLTLGLDALILKPFDFTILEDNIAGLTSAAA